MNIYSFQQQKKERETKTIIGINIKSIHDYKIYFNYGKGCFRGQNIIEED